MSQTNPYSAQQELLALYAARKPELAFRAADKNEWLTWGAAFRAKLLELMGPFPLERCDLEPQVLSVDKCEGYIRERVVLQTNPGVRVPAYVLCPDKGSGPWPGMLCLHGHGRGKDDVVGITTTEEEKQHIARLNYNYAEEFVRRGYVTITPDARGFGERKEGYKLNGRDGCNVFFLKYMLLGLNPLTLNVWDVMRCLDYLQERPEVEGDRVGCVGLSYGGTLTLYASALDERVKAAIISCYLNKFKAYAYDIDNTCGSQTVPGLLRYGEMAEVACLIAPRPLLIETGIKDEGFPIAATREAYAVVRTAYEAAGVPDRLAIDEFDGGHEFSGRLAFDFLSRWL